MLKGLFGYLDLELCKLGTYGLADIEQAEEFVLVTFPVGLVQIGDSPISTFLSVAEIWKCGRQNTPLASCESMVSASEELYTCVSALVGSPRISPPSITVTVREP